MSPIPWGHEAPKCQSSKLIQKCHCSTATSLAFLSFYLTIPSSLISHSEYEALSGENSQSVLIFLWEILLRGFRKAETTCLYLCLWTALRTERTNEYRLKENHTINPSKINSSSWMLHFYFRVGSTLTCHRRRSMAGSGSSWHAPTFNPVCFTPFNNTNVFSLH